MERIEDWKTEVSNLYLKCRRQKLKSEFFRSCVSEGLIPNGVKGKFNLAMDVNNQDFVQSIEEEMDFHSSRILDLLLIHSQVLEGQLEAQQNDFIQLGRALLDDVDIQQSVRNIKAEMENQVKETDRTLKAKLIKLRNEKITGRLPQGWSRGSRKIKDFK